MPLASGTRLGPYEIVAPIGAGGMGEVYRARDTRLERTVALKILPSHLAQEPEFRQRFEQEARAISALNHPHICVLHDVGRQDGIDFLVMEHLEGETLSHRLRKGALPLDQVLRHGVEIAEALDRAHRQGIVHRDLKPGNVMLTRAGTKLLDFGLAKVRPSRPAGEHEPTLTEAGGLLGTPRYMAPEQLEGKEPDARSDIFALGTVLYEMATGQRAFPAKGQAGLVTAILSSEPAPVSRIRPATPPALDRAVATCLAKDPDDRWQSAQDLATELRWIGTDGGPPASVASPRRWRGWLGRTGVGLVLTLLGIGAGLVLSRRAERPEREPKARFEIPAPDKATILGSAGLAVSPDGERIVFRASVEGKSQLYLRPLDALAATPIPGTEGGVEPFWSPDGRQIAFMAEGKLRKVDLSGGSDQVLSEVLYDEAGFFLGGAWSSDDTIVLSLRGDLFRLPARGGTIEPLGRRDDGETRRCWPQFLPDGRHFLYLSDDSRPERQGIYVAALGSNDRKRILASETNAVYASSGHLLFLRGDALVAQPFDAARLELSGEPVSVGVHPKVYRSAVSGIINLVPWAGFSVSPSGVFAWFPGSSSADTTTLTWFDRAGKELGAVGEPAVYTNPALSPDGRSLAVDVRNPSGNRDVWVFDLVRGGRTRLTFDPAEDFGAAWSPDGTRIAFVSQRRGSRELYQKLANGSGADELLLESKDALVSSEDWSPDGKWLVFNRRRQGPPDLYVLPMSRGRDPTPIPFVATEFREDMGQFSPNGRFLAYRSDESGRPEVYVRDVSPDGTAGHGKWQVSTAGGLEPQWRRDGKELFYVHVPGVAATSGGPGPGTLHAVTVTTDGRSFEAGAPRPLFEVRMSEQRRNRYVVTGDGQRFLVNRENTVSDVQSIQVLVNALPRKR
jgi:eukaryotic-like serine/threonine-protein kinase